MVFWRFFHLRKASARISRNASAATPPRTLPATVAAPGPSEDPESSPVDEVLEDVGCALPPAPKPPSPVEVAEAVPKDSKDDVDADLEFVVVVAEVEVEVEEEEPDENKLLANTDSVEELLKLSSENECIKEVLEEVLLGKSEEVGTAFV